MYTKYYIELRPVKLIYFNGYHHGEICTTTEIEYTRFFNTYSDAQKELSTIIRLNTNNDFYISIVEVYISIND